MAKPKHLPSRPARQAARLDFIAKAAARMARDSRQVFRPAPQPKAGATLRPGRETPLWNALRKQLQPHLKQHGAQAGLARLLGLQRQQVNAFVTTGGRMPDAERTLQLLAWLMAQSDSRPPARLS
jgi:hypothetical protein